MVFPHLQINLIHQIQEHFSPNLETNTSDAIELKKPTKKTESIFFSVLV
ncbi:MAG: hypothetical protein Q8K60_02195 [Parachlamydiaceae bacterium]|nr:hypothetical protein [Parachlamydiaceae bacterium]